MLLSVYLVYWLLLGGRSSALPPRRLRPRQLDDFHAIHDPRCAALLQSTTSLPSSILSPTATATMTTSSPGTTRTGRSKWLTGTPGVGKVAVALALVVSAMQLVKRIIIDRRSSWTKMNWSKSAKDLRLVFKSNFPSFQDARRHRSLLTATRLLLNWTLERHRASVGRTAGSGGLEFRRKSAEEVGSNQQEQMDPMSKVLRAREETWCKLQEIKLQLVQLRNELFQLDQRLNQQQKQQQHSESQMTSTTTTTTTTPLVASNMTADASDVIGSIMPDGIREPAVNYIVQINQYNHQQHPQLKQTEVG